MDTFSILLIALGLSMDCFAIALGISCSGKKVSRTAYFKVAAAFGIAQAVMPVIGWLAGIAAALMGTGALWMELQKSWYAPKKIKAK